MYMISSGESATLADCIYPAFPTTLVEAMWDVVWLYWLYVWRCLFSIIEAMICIGSGWSAVGWTGTLHLVTHTHTDTLKVYQSCSYYSYKPLVHSRKETHHFEGNCQTGGVCGAIVMVTTLDHAELYQWQDFDWPSLNLQLPLQLRKDAIKYMANSIKLSRFPTGSW